MEAFTDALFVFQKILVLKGLAINVAKDSAELVVKHEPMHAKSQSSKRDSSSMKNYGLYMMESENLGTRQSCCRCCQTGHSKILKSLQSETAIIIQPSSIQSTIRICKDRSRIKKFDLKYCQLCTSICTAGDLK